MSGHHRFLLAEQLFFLSLEPIEASGRGSVSGPDIGRILIEVSSSGWFTGLKSQISSELNGITITHCQIYE